VACATTPRTGWSYRTPSSSPSVGAGSRGFARDEVLRDRQVDAERRAHVRLTEHGDVAAGLFHDAVHDRQPEASAAAGFLGREERLEDVLERLARHAVSGIGDRNRDVAPGLEPALATREIVGHDYRVGLDRGTAALRPGIG